METDLNPKNIYLINTKNQQKYLLLYVSFLKYQKQTNSKKKTHLLVLIPLKTESRIILKISTVPVV
jgi:hypothetical protein